MYNVHILIIIVYLLKKKIEKIIYISAYKDRSFQMKNKSERNSIKRVWINLNLIVYSNVSCNFLYF